MRRTPDANGPVRNNRSSRDVYKRQIDGVRAGEHHAVCIQSCFDGRVGKDFLNAGLGIVKVSLNCADSNILSFLHLHLTLLHLADAVLRIKDKNSGARYIAEALPLIHI